MIIAIADVLSAADVAEVTAGLADATFVDGRSTAGWAAKLVKANLQAEHGPRLDAVAGLVESRLAAQPVFTLALRPKTILGPMFSRYETGHAYGQHVDDALMGGVRTDCSFTLFLSPPETYDGGELIISTSAGEDAYKLAAGSLVAYPSSSLHRVAPVTRGARLAAVGWVRSYIRDAAKRELLFDLETARRRLFDREGKTEDGDLLAKCAANL
ncbi:MAG TPA: Fe2+-dependent dioxygenase, partial [Hyphomicrobiaceae bacterium]|nr:Fe2+-dependent dioxygenase [Hyphomicrobiaceae bacterium]